MSDGPKDSNTCRNVKPKGKKTNYTFKKKQNKKRDKSKTNVDIRRVNVVLRQTFTTQLWVFSKRSNLRLNKSETHIKQFLFSLLNEVVNRLVKYV